MRYIFKFPDIGEGISEGKILKWYVKKGQKIKSGESLVNMETDKVVTDIPSPKGGVITALFGREGEVINVDAPLVELNIEGVNAAEARGIALETVKSAAEKAVEETGFGVVGSIEVAGDAAYLPSSQEGLAPRVEEKHSSRKRVLATPVARAMAADLGVDLDLAKGSGPAGRVLKNDIQLAYEQKMAATPNARASEKEGGSEAGPRIEYQPLSQIRKTIARNMIRSKQSAAHMTLLEEVEVSELIRIRQKHRDDFSKMGSKLTYMPFIIKAVAQALKDHPTLNAEMDLENGRLILKKDYNIGIAVDTEDGLVVPVIREVNRRSVLDLSQELIDLADRARERKLTLADIKHGTFTVTNYGSIGGTYGVPVINYPQTAILGIGRIAKRPVVEKDNIVIGQVLPLSMSVDHRVVDGGEAARFILKVIKYLQDPVSLLLIQSS